MRRASKSEPLFVPHLSWIVTALVMSFSGCAASPEAPAVTTDHPETTKAAPIELPPLAGVEDRSTQIALAVHAAPPEFRDETTVLGYTAEGDLVTLRRGDNHIICIGDKPGDDRFQVACYQKDLEAYMSRGRELRAQGMTSPDALDKRHQEIEEGLLAMPSDPAVVYSLGGPLEVANAETGEVHGARLVYALYTPFATEASTGLSTTPAAPGAPWIMRPGTATSHVMVTPPAAPVQAAVAASQ